MFFQDATPDTSGYMIAGFAITFIVMALYVVSIYLRNRNLHQDMTLLEEMDKPAQPVKATQPKKSPAIHSNNNKSAKPVTKKSRQK
jgi:hypothetical protein